MCGKTWVENMLSPEEIIWIQDTKEERPRIEHHSVGKSMAMNGHLGVLLLCALSHLTLASDHSGFPTWLSNNLE